MAPIVGAAIGAAATLAVQLLVRLHKAASENKDRSTTSSAGGGAAAYETKKAVDEYIQFHFAAEEDLLPFAEGPKVGMRGLPS